MAKRRPLLASVPARLRRVPRAIALIASSICTSACQEPPTPAATAPPAHRAAALGRPKAAGQQDLDATRSAAVVFVGRGDAQAAADLAEQIRLLDNAQALDVVLEVLAKAELRPSSLLTKALLAQLERFDPSHRDGQSLARAIGRSIDGNTLKLVVDFATLPSHAVWQRVVAITALGHYRDRAAAATLLKLRGSEQEAIRRAASAALEYLAVPHGSRQKEQRWRYWFEKHAHLAPDPWRQQLFEEVTHQAEGKMRQLTDRQSQAQQQLDAAHLHVEELDDLVVDMKQKLYRATPEAERPALLSSWLVDQQAASRRLAIELANQRLTANRRFDEPLREALRTRLADPLPDMRQKATLLLWNLADQPSAEMVALRMRSGQETETQVNGAYLLLLERVPHRLAVEPALQLLSDPVLRGSAAGALAASRDLLSAPQVREAAARVRSVLDEQTTPPPQVVRLLAKVGSSADWKLIERWLDSEDEQVKEAAARAWAESTNPSQPLWKLTERAADPPIRPIAITAARQRGRDTRTMLGLLKNRPDDELIVATWQRALIEMAERVPIEAIVKADSLLAVDQDSVELRQQLLSAAIARLRRSSGGQELPTDSNAPQTGVPVEPLTAAQQKMLLLLLLSRGHLRLDLGQPKAALADFQQVETLTEIQLGAEQKRRVDIAFLRTFLLLGDTKRLEEKAREMLDAAAQQDPTLAGEVADVFIDQIDRSIVSQQYGRAQQLMQLLATLLGQDMPAHAARRVAQVQQVIEQASDSQTSDASDDEPQP